MFGNYYQHAWYSGEMALVGLIRVRSVARLAGVCPATAIRWMRAAGADIIRAPVVGMPGRSGTGNGSGSPLYVSLDAGLRLLDRMLSGKADRVVRERTQHRLREAARELERSSAGIRHQIGGTGSGAPMPKLPL